MCVHLIVIFLEIAIVNIPKTPPHHHLQDIHAAVEALLVAVTNALALLSIKLVKKKRWAFIIPVFEALQRERPRRKATSRSRHNISTRAKER
jgi:hypothetical protein